MGASFGAVAPAGKDIGAVISWYSGCGGHIGERNKHRAVGLLTPAFYYIDGDAARAGRSLRLSPWGAAFKTRRHRLQLSPTAISASY